MGTAFALGKYSIACNLTNRFFIRRYEDRERLDRLESERNFSRLRA